MSTGVVANCFSCGDEYPRLNHDQLYCSVTCKRRAARHRKSDEKLVGLNLNLVGRCPTPHKVGWSSYQQAALNKWSDESFIYRCVCGGLHFTSRNRGKKTRRVSEVLEFIAEKQKEREQSECDC